MVRVARSSGVVVVVVVVGWLEADWREVVVVVGGGGGGGIRGIRGIRDQSFFAVDEIASSYTPLIINASIFFFSKFIHADQSISPPPPPPAPEINRERRSNTLPEFVFTSFALSNFGS